MHKVNFPTPEIRFVVLGAAGALRVCTGDDDVPADKLREVVESCESELSRWLGAVEGEFKPRNGMLAEWRGITRHCAARVCADYVSKVRDELWRGLPLKHLDPQDATVLLERIFQEGIDAEQRRGNSVAIPRYDQHGRRLDAFNRPISDPASEPPTSGDCSSADLDEGNCRPREKRSTNNGDALDGWIARLNAHHGYQSNDIETKSRCKNYIPIQNNALAGKTENDRICSKGHSSTLFKKHFGGYAAYKRMCRHEPGKLDALLIFLNRDFKLLDTDRRQFRDSSSGEE